MGVDYQFKCLHCRKMRRKDARNRWHQKYCSELECQGASKRASQLKWRSRPENRDYDRGAEAVKRTRAWRAQNPGYSKKSKRSCNVERSKETLQDIIDTQVVVNEEDAKVDISAPKPLQDVLPLDPFVIVGLISTMTGSTLQEDIAQQIRSLSSLGRDIQHRGGADPDLYEQQHPPPMCRATAGRAGSV